MRGLLGSVTDRGQDGRITPATKGTRMTTLNGHANGTTAPFEVRPAPTFRWPQAEPGRDRWQRVAAARHAVTSHRGWLAAVPIVLVNTVATGAQLGFWRVHLPEQAAVLVALALESIAIYLAWQAHLAQLADDSALRLRLAAYTFALVIGVLNYSHFMLAGWRPTVAAVTFGLMSAVSPWLWSIHSRRESRAALKAKGLIEPHGVRLGMTRWVWHGYRSFRVMRWATWAGENDPVRAIAAVYPPLAATGDTTPVATGDSGDKEDDERSGQPGKNGGDGTGLAGSSLDKVVAVTAPATTGDATPVATPRDSGGKLTVEEEAARDGVSVRTVQRRRAKNRSTT